MKKLNLREQKHNSWLETIVNHLNLIGEEPDEVAWVMKNGIWQKEDRTGFHFMPDIILEYHRIGGNLRDYLIVEFKHSRKHKQKAYQQIESGKAFLEEFHDATRHEIRGKFVYLNRNKEL